MQTPAPRVLNAPTPRLDSPSAFERGVAQALLVTPPVTPPVTAPIMIPARVNPTPIEPPRMVLETAKPRAELVTPQELPAVAAKVAAVPPTTVAVTSPLAPSSASAGATVQATRGAQASAPQSEESPETPAEEAQAPRPKPVRVGVTDGTGFGSDRLDSTAMVTLPISCVVLGGRMYCTTMHATPWGVVGLSGSVRAPGRRNGAVGMDHFGADPQAETVATNAGARMLSNAETQKIRLATEGLVERARCGDQNAMAMIAEVRDKATKQPRNKRAQMAFKALKDYVQKHPVAEHALTDQMGADSLGASAVLAPVQSFPLSRERTMQRTAVTLANSAPMSKAHVLHMASTFCGGDPKAAQVILMGVGVPGKPMPAGAAPGVQNLHDLGRSIGMARRIQQAREPKASVASLGRVVSWELD